MYNRRKSLVVRLIALLMITVMVVPLGAGAATGNTVQPYASYYLSSYGASAYRASGNVIQIYFNAQGTGYMDELGALSIEIYESTDKVNWTWKTTFNHDTTSGMLSYDDDYHSSSVSYQGISNRYYKAYVCIWGGKNGSGDTRYFYTNIV